MARSLIKTINKGMRDKCRFVIIRPCLIEDWIDGRGIAIFGQLHKEKNHWLNSRLQFRIVVYTFTLLFANVEV